MNPLINVTTNSTLLPITKYLNRRLINLNLSFTKNKTKPLIQLNKFNFCSELNNNSKFNISKEYFKNKIYLKPHLKISYQKNSSNKLIKISSKGFLKFRGYFESLNLTSISKEVEVYHINDPLVFENKKYTILEVSSQTSNKLNRINYFLVYPLCVFSGYSFISAILKLKFFSTMFWTFILYYSIRLQQGIVSNQKHIIKKINLLEDGKTCEILTNSCQFHVDINKMRKINMEEAMYMAKKLDSLKSNYIPIVLDTKLYLIPLVCSVIRPDVLAAVCEGKYIEFEEIIDKDNTIQI